MLWMAAVKGDFPAASIAGNGFVIPNPRPIASSDFGLTALG
jgi:hypothetical protein